MSIADNVCETNNRLATARTILREKLTANGIQYDNSDTIFELLKRWSYTNFAGYYFLFFPDDNVKEGAEISAGVTVYDNDDNGVEGVPAEVIINGTSYKVYSDSEGRAEKTFTAGNAGDELEVTVIAGSDSQTNTYTIESAYEFTDDGEQDTDLYDVIKYPTSMSHTFSTYEYDSKYSKYGYLLSKAVTSSSVVMLIPKGMKAYDSTGIHFSVKMVQKKNSNSGWGDAIALINSKELSHYRDTKILELGAYNAKKGVKYSNANHVVNDVNTTTGQLTLDSVWYTFELYYDNGYLKATIMNGTTQVYSYEGDVSSLISLDSFYPAIMVYEYGGAMLFDNVVIEPWIDKMSEKEWIEIGTVMGDTGPKGDTGDIGIGTIVKGHYDSYADFIAVHPSGRLGDAYIVDGSYYYWNENGWANAGSVKGDTGETGAKGDKGDKGVKGDTGATGPQGEKGDTGIGLTIKESYSSYEELINDHPIGSEGDSYLVNGSLYVWNGTSWENVGNIKGEKGDKGDTGDKGVKGDTGAKGDTGVKGDTGDKGSTGDVVPKEKKVILEQVLTLMSTMTLES